MKIQRITHKGYGQGYKTIECDYITESSLDNPQTLDGFEYNIIDVSDKELWVNSGHNTSAIDKLNDLKSLCSMISGTKKTIIIIALPQNINFTIKRGYREAAHYDYVPLRDKVGDLLGILSYLLDCSSDVPYFELLYEATKTSLNGTESSAAFHFGNEEELEEWNQALTKSIHGEKVTTIEISIENESSVVSRIVTTLELDSESKITSFLEATNLVQEREIAPIWFDSIRRFDDDKKTAQISKCNEIIRQQKDIIDESESVLEKNNRWKSILYTQGEELVTTIFEIFTEMLGCHLDDFVDDNNEDFLFEVENITFIGEIKGVTRNVKREHIAQLDTHYGRYLDDEENSDKNVKALLVINHQREIPLGERKEVPENQIQIAERNGSLIIETTTLLDLFEKYRNNEIERDECVELLYTKTGLLTL